ncbi:MAG: Arm DNA-binding domain-containing protein [Acidobacteria bacterium]|nr:Arm DNA-binding domain-containing protein [Acidobacteriota bacterium]
MLSLVSGRFPGPPPVESELFKAWIDTLWELPASPPEWPADAANLGKWIRYILREKERELIEGVVHQIADQWSGIENEFNDDLHYLGIGALTLQAPPVGPELLIGTLEFLTALRVQLEAYRPLRPQAASRQEEIERSEARRAAEEGILKLTAEWQERMARARQAGRHCDGQGLYLVVQPSGTRSWVQRLVIRGRKREFGLGSAVLVSLAEARERGLSNRKLAREGGDPLAEKRRADAMPTFADAAAASSRRSGPDGTAPSMPGPG